MIYYNGKWFIEPEIKAELDRLNCEIDRLERENAVLRSAIEKNKNEKSKQKAFINYDPDGWYE